MFREIDLTQVKENFVDLLKNQWGLITAGDAEALNMMTVSWGAVGELWGMDMLTAYVRPQRYTKEFLDKCSHFSFSVYPSELKSIHGICGSKSGREINKTEATGLVPVFEENAPYFEQAKLVVICRKVAVSRFEPAQFIDEKLIEENYPSRDFHNIYYGAVEKVLLKDC